METRMKSAAATGTKTKTATTTTPDTTSTETKTVKTKATTPEITETKATAQTPETSLQTPETGPQTPTEATETGTTQTAEDATSTPGENSTGDTKTTKETTEDATGALVLDYLSRGYFKGDEKARYMAPDLVGETAQRLAQGLAAGGLKQKAINPILRELKKANKKTLPLDAKQGALSGAIVQAKQLQQRKRAPSLLVDILKYNKTAVQTDADYTVAVRHLTAVSVFLGDYQK